jgi:hypothetical protein
MRRLEAEERCPVACRVALPTNALAPRNPAQLRPFSLPTIPPLAGSTSYQGGRR